MPAPTWMLLNELHSSNTACPITVVPAGTVNSLSFVDANARGPIEDTLSGSETDASFSHLSNADSPISSSPSSNCIFTILLA